MNNLENKRQKKTRKRCKCSRPSFPQSKVRVPKRDQTRLLHRADEATFTFHTLWRQMRFIQQHLVNWNKAFFSFSLSLYLSVCVWALGVSGCDWVWMNCLHKRSVLSYDPPHKPLCSPTQKEGSCSMNFDVDIKQVTSFKTPKQYGCVKLRHEISCKLLKQVCHKHAWQNEDAEAQITQAPSAAQ